MSSSFSNLRLIGHCFIWATYFNKGLIEEFTSFYPILNQICIILIVALTFYGLTLGKRLLPHYMLVLIIAVLSLFSGSINGIPLIDSIYFFRQFIFLQYLYFLAVVNEPSKSFIQIIFNFVRILFFTQIIANIVKFILIGFSESPIGTVSNSEGSITTVITLIGCTYGLTKYYQKKDHKGLLIVFMFVLFGIIGEKRAIFILLPLLIFLMSIINQIFQGGSKSIKPLKLFGTPLLLSTLIIYFVSIFNPTLNEEESFEGSFNPSYAINYLFEYMKPDRARLFELSRLESIVFLSFYNLNQPFVKSLVGDGAGKLSAKNSTYDPLNPEIEISPTTRFYGIRYGGRTAYAWTLIQVGILGIVLYGILLFKMLVNVFKTSNTSHKLLFFGIFFTIFVDFFYSTVSFKYFIISATFFGLYGIMIRNEPKIYYK